MNENQENKLKVRWKFRSGEEFEAEGNRDFIENQRAYFLSLIGKQGSIQSIKEPSTTAVERLRPASVPQPAGTINPYIPAVHRSARKPEVAPTAIDTSLWERIVKTEDGIVIFRRKSRMLTAETAGLLLIAAAKVLLKADNGYSALNLSKSMKKSGYNEGRLDRILQTELKAGAISSIGSKRSRAYRVSDEGFARAFVLAEKLTEDY